VTPRPLTADRLCDLTDAIRPAAHSSDTLVEGYRLETYRGRPGLRIPALAAAVSRDRIFDIFLQLLGPLGEVVDVVLETSHGNTADRHRDLRRTHIDRPVLESYFCEFEDLLLNDGCTGVAVVASGRPMEVQFDEHKLLVIYAGNLKPFERIMKEHGIRQNDKVKLITEGEHLHSTDESYRDQFEQFCYRLGVGKSFERVESGDWSES